MTATGVPTLDINFADPDVLQDPYPLFDAIRQAGPAVYNPSAGGWMVASYEHVKAVLLDDRTFVPEADKWETLYGAAVVESMEDPRHKEVRGMLAPDFRANHLRQLRAPVTDLVTRRLGHAAQRLRDGNVVDVVPEITRAVAGRVLAAHHRGDRAGRPKVPGVGERHGCHAGVLRRAGSGARGSPAADGH